MDTLDLTSLQEMFTTVKAFMMEHRADFQTSCGFESVESQVLSILEGFDALSCSLNTAQGDIAKALYFAAMKMASAAPTVIGTLMASGVMGGAKQLRGVERIGAREYCDFLFGFEDAVRSYEYTETGGFLLSHKIHNASVYAKNALDEYGTLSSVAQAATEGAKRRIESQEREPGFGKTQEAAYPHEDIITPGAVAGELLITAMGSYICDH